MIAPTPRPTSTPPLLSQTGVVAVSVVGSVIVLIAFLGGLWCFRKKLWKQFRGKKRTMVVPVNGNVDMDMNPVSPPHPAPSTPIPTPLLPVEVPRVHDSPSIHTSKSDKRQQSDIEKNEEDVAVGSVVSKKPTQDVPRTPPSHPNPNLNPAESPSSWEQLTPDVLRTKPTNHNISELPSRIDYHAAQAYRAAHAAEKVSDHNTTHRLHTSSPFIQFILLKNKPL